MQIKLRFFAWFLVAAFGSSQLYADAAISFSSPVNQGEEMVLTVSGDRAAMELPESNGEKSRMIYNKAENTLYMVMDTSRQYMDMDAMMKSLSGLSGMLSGMMEGLPDDAKGQLSGMLGNLGGQQQPAAPAAKPELVNTGKSDSVAGISCDIVTYETTSGVTEMCLTSPSAAGVSAADFAVIQAMMAKQKESASQAGEMLGMSGMDMGPGAIDRMPLRIKQLSGTDAGSNAEFKSVSPAIDASVLEIPADYNVMSFGG